MRRFSVPVLGVALLLFGAAPPAQAARRITEYPVPPSGQRLEGIAAGPDGNLWFTERDAEPRGPGSQRRLDPGLNKIGQITTKGMVTEYPIPTLYSEPWGIAAGPDGNMWFQEHTTYGKIGRITPGGVITEFPITRGSGEGIAAGPDGNMWYTVIQARIGRITTDGVMTEFPLSDPYSDPTEIAAGPDGAMWFTESNHGKIGRVTMDGVITDYPLTTLSCNPMGSPPALTARCGSPSSRATRSAASLRMGSSPSTRSPPPTAAPRGSRLVRTAIFGSPKSTARSAG
jgi:virginiamycin B lyase